MDSECCDISKMEKQVGSLDCYHITNTRKLATFQKKGTGTNSLLSIVIFQGQENCMALC